jgi:hypothetical protein
MEDDDLPLDGEAGDIVTPPISDAAIADAAQDVIDTQPAPRTVEDIAQGMGWAPREQWRGDPAKWKPADEFVATTAEINSKLSTRLKGLEDQLSSINRTNAAMMEKALAEQRQKLLTERREAIEYGDVAKVDALDQELQALPTPQPAPPPEAVSFIERNASWWEKDQEATAWARNRAGELGQQGIGPARQIAIVERELAQFFPEYAPQDKPKPRPAPLTQPGARSATPRGKTFADLPKEAQEAALYFEKKGVSREDYIKSFFEGQE